VSARYTAGLPTRSAYENMLAERIRGELFAMLGPTCAGCECDLHGIAWEFNHLYRREWSPRKLSRYRRNARYLREAQAGLGDLRCPACNREYRPVQAPPREPAPPAELCPF
jgi:hypothetical protein